MGLTITLVCFLLSLILLRWSDQEKQKAAERRRRTDTLGRVFDLIAELEDEVSKL